MLRPGLAPPTETSPHACEANHQPTRLLKSADVQRTAPREQGLLCRVNPEARRFCHGSAGTAPGCLRAKRLGGVGQFSADLDLALRGGISQPVVCVKKRKMLGGGREADPVQGNTEGTAYSGARWSGKTKKKKRRCDRTVGLYGLSHDASRWSDVG